MSWAATPSSGISGGDPTGITTEGIIYATVDGTPEVDAPIVDEWPDNGGKVHTLTGSWFKEGYVYQVIPELSTGERITTYSGVAEQGTTDNGSGQLGYNLICTVSGSIEYVSIPRTVGERITTLYVQELGTVEEVDSGTNSGVTSIAAQADIPIVKRSFGSYLYQMRAFAPPPRTPGPWSIREEPFDPTELPERT